MSDASTEIVRSLSIMIHGPSKAGKSTLASTAPAPRLILDAEHGHKFLPLKMRYWDPMKDNPPTPDGTWDTAVVVIRRYDDVLQVYRWLQSGAHPFKSVIIDSISEIQTKCLENIAGREQVKMQQWGDLLRHMTGLMRDLRDLTMHPTKTKIVDAETDGFDFLGYRFLRHRRFPRKKSLAKFRDVIRGKTKRTSGRSLHAIIADVNRTLVGWFEYFQQNKVPFTEYNVAQDPRRAEEMVRKSGQMGVPVIDVHGKIIVGFNQPEVERALRR